MITFELLKEKYLLNQWSLSDYSDFSSWRVEMKSLGSFRISSAEPPFSISVYRDMGEGMHPQYRLDLSWGESVSFFSLDSFLIREMEKFISWMEKMGQKRQKRANERS